MNPQTLRATAISLPRRKKIDDEKSSQIPEQTRSSVACVHFLCPLFTEANFVEPVADSNCRKKDGERRHRQRPWLLMEKQAGDAEHVGGDFGEAAVIAADAAAPCAKPGEELFHSARAGNFG